MQRQLCCIGIAAVFLFSVALPASAQNATQEQNEKRPQMMEMHKEKHQQMAQRIDHLESLLEEMNHASGEERIDAIAAVVNELASQHIEMHRMMQEKMGHGRMDTDRREMRQK